MEGASWSKSEHSLYESEPKKLFSPLPILHVTAITSTQQRGVSADYGPYGPYQCPCYRYTMRTDKNLIFMVDIATRHHRPVHWTLRGVALLCSIE